MKIDNINMELDQIILRLEFFKNRIKGIIWDSKCDIKNYKIELSEIIGDLNYLKEKCL